jgi:hypothetical protein
MFEGAKKADGDASVFGSWARNGDLTKGLGGRGEGC